MANCHVLAADWFSSNNEIIKKAARNAKEPRGKMKKLKKNEKRCVMCHKNIWIDRLFAQNCQCIEPNDCSHWNRRCTLPRLIGNYISQRIRWNANKRTLAALINGIIKSSCALSLSLSLASMSIRLWQYQSNQITSYKMLCIHQWLGFSRFSWVYVIGIIGRFLLHVYHCMCIQAVDISRLSVWIFTVIIIMPRTIRITTVDNVTCRFVCIELGSIFSTRISQLKSPITKAIGLGRVPDVT